MAWLSRNVERFQEISTIFIAGIILKGFGKLCENIVVYVNRKEQPTFNKKYYTTSTKSSSSASSSRRLKHLQASSISDSILFLDPLFFPCSLS